MFQTESSPLVKSNDTKPKSATIWIICLAISAIVLITIFYHGKGSATAQNMSQIAVKSDINGPALLQTRFPKYPADSILKKYRSMTRMIEYKAEELPQSMDATDFDSREMQEFHSQLIETHGFDHTLHNIVFSVSDSSQYQSDLENNIDDMHSSATAKDKLTCKYLYSYASSADSDSGRFMELNCPVDYVITGCTSISRYSDGMRWGELAYDTSDCFTHATSETQTGFYGTLLTASCCKVQNTQVETSVELHTSYSTSSTSNSDFCVETECAADMVSCGCTATDSHQATNKFSGTTWLRNSHFLSGCRAQRSDLGYLWQTAYCAQLMNSNSKNDLKLICTSSDGEHAVLKKYGHYESEAICSGKGYVMTDCNAHISHEIHYCTAGKAYGNDFGVLYGSYMFNGQSSTTRSRGPICSAVGSTDAVVAEVICCKIR